MPTISAWIVKKPRKIRFCEGYRHFVMMPAGKPQVRIYGNAFQGDPCFEMFICLDCALRSDDKKITAAIENRLREKLANAR